MMFNSQNATQSTQPNYTALQHVMSLASPETKKLIKNRLQFLSAKERTFFYNNSSLLCYISKNLLSFDDFFSLTETQISRLNTPYIQSLIDSSVITMSEVLQLNSQRAIILCSKPVRLLIEHEAITINEALKLNNTFEFLNQNISLVHAIGDKDLTPQECINFYDSIKPYPTLLNDLNQNQITLDYAKYCINLYNKMKRLYPELWNTFLQNRISIDDASLCVQLFQDISLEKVLAHHMPDIIRMFYRHETECSVIPNTFNQFCAINHGLIFFAKKIIQTRIEILENYPEIKPLFLNQILSIPEQCNRLGYLEKLSQSKGYRAFCSSTIKLSQNPFQLFNKAHQENKNQVSMLNTNAAIILFYYTIAMSACLTNSSSATALSFTTLTTHESDQTLSDVSSISIKL